VKSLSVGERNRLLLARLLSRPADVLVLDNPTNDLDIETLELLEELLDRFDGTVFMVSHDRVFLNNVATQIIAFEGDGKLVEYVGGYEDWIRVKQQAAGEAPHSGKASQRDAAQAQQASRAAALKIAEHREHFRHPVHWRAAIIHKNVDRNDIYHGRTQDLSVSGASIYIHHNIFSQRW